MAWVLISQELEPPPPPRNADPTPAEFFLEFRSVVFLMGLGFGLRFKLISLLVHIPLVIFN